MDSSTHEQNSICSQKKLNDIAHEHTIICRQLFAGHVVGSRPMKRKKHLHRMIISFVLRYLKTYLNRIYYLQKRAVQAITNSEYRAHTALLFSKLEILDIFQVNTFNTAKFMFLYHNKLLPPLFCNLFMTNSQVHRYDCYTGNLLEDE